MGEPLPRSNARAQRLAFIPPAFEDFEVEFRVPGARSAEVRHTADTMLFAERPKRLTDIPGRGGNFSLIPAPAPRRLMCMAQLWNQYAGALLHSRLPQRRTTLDRGSRVHGRSRMGSLIPLVVDDNAGIATLCDVFRTTLAVPSWVTYIIGVLLALSVRICSSAFGIPLSLSTSRQSATFVPCRN